MRRSTKVLFALLILAIICIGAVVGLMGLLPGGRAPILTNESSPLATIPLPSWPYLLDWSADGNFIATSSSSMAGIKPGKAEVIIVDAGKNNIAAQLKVPGLVNVLAFSPDAKWLAVAVNTWGEADLAFATELVLFDVPAFTPKFTAKAKKPKNQFIDLAWTAGSKCLHAIEAEDSLGTNAEFRGWDMPAFTERTATKTDWARKSEFKALAASPDGGTIAFTEFNSSGKLRIHVQALVKGPQSNVIQAAGTKPRLGYSADNSAIGLFDEDTGSLSWWNLKTGQAVKPGELRFGIQPPNCNLSPDGNMCVLASERVRLFSDIGAGIDGRDKEYGAFVELKQFTPEKIWKWRVGPGRKPDIAFSPDGTKFAATTTDENNGSAIAIWAVPK